jgi:hypothetical protein
MATHDTIAAFPRHTPAATARAPRRPATPVSLDPASAYEAITRQMVLNLDAELREIKTRLNGLLFMVAGSLLLDVALRLLTDR